MIVFNQTFCRPYNSVFMKGPFLIPAAGAGADRIQRQKGGTAGLSPL